MTKVSFNGLGAMGAGMARRLLGAGFEVTVYNRSPRAAEELRADGARVAATPADGARGAEIVITMVSDDNASREVWLGAKGALAAAAPGAILIDCSTITPEWARELAQAAEKHGCAFLDAPVTGSRPQAQNGELLFLVGGLAEALEKARPALTPMSRGILHLGGHGAGATMKLINNFLCGVQAAALAEALAWIDRSGLERAEAVSVLTGGAPGSPLVKTLASRMEKQNGDVNFRLELMAKDLTYAKREAARSGLDLETGDAALERFQDAVKDGFGGRDLSAIGLHLLSSGQVRP